jgi:hypothetical protein
MRSVGFGVLLAQQLVDELIYERDGNEAPSFRQAEVRLMGPRLIFKNR